MFFFFQCIKFKIFKRDIYLAQNILLFTSYSAAGICLLMIHNISKTCRFSTNVFSRQTKDMHLLCALEYIGFLFLFHLSQKKLGIFLRFVNYKCARLLEMSIIRIHYVTTKQFKVHQTVNPPPSIMV